MPRHELHSPHAPPKNKWVKREQANFQAYLSGVHYLKIAWSCNTLSKIHVLFYISIEYFVKE